MFHSSARKPGGYATWSQPGSKVVEKDTLQCVHCGFTWFVEPGSGHLRGFCTMCNGPTCGHQNCMPCKPLMKRIEESERVSKQYGGITYQ